MILKMGSNQSDYISREILNNINIWSRNRPNIQSEASTVVQTNIHTNSIEGNELLRNIRTDSSRLEGQNLIFVSLLDIMVHSHIDCLN
jgi:hypothetical protein